jgi:hypothetical protein
MEKILMEAVVTYFNALSLHLHEGENKKICSNYALAIDSDESLFRCQLLLDLCKLDY